MLFYWLILTCFGYFVSSEKLDYFSICDANNNNKIEFEEFSSCLRLSNANDQITLKDLSSLFETLDRNHDKSISTVEFNNALEIVGKMKKLHDSDKEEEEEEKLIEVTTRDGVKKQMRNKDFYNVFQENLKGFKRHSNNQITKEETNQTSIHDLENHNPTLSAFIKLAQWSHKFLIYHKFINGTMNNSTSTKLLKVQSLSPDGEDIPEDDPQMDFQQYIINIDNKQPFHLHLKLFVQEEHGKNIYKVHLEYNPEIYHHPYLSMIEAYRIDSKKKSIIQLSLPPTPLYSRRKTRYLSIGSIKIPLAQIGIFCVVICLVILLIHQFCYSTKDQKKD